MNIKNIFCTIILLLSVALISSCSAGTSTNSTEPDSSQSTSQSASTNSTEPDSSQPISQSVSEVNSSASVPEESPAFSAVTQNIKTVDFSSEQSALKDYIRFARSNINRAFLNGDECIITLRNVLGDEKPEMIIAVKKSQSLYAEEFYFSTNENGEPIYLGALSSVHNAFYTDGEFVYAILEMETANGNGIGISKLHPLENPAYPDLAEYQNSDALDFVNNIHMNFFRYDNRDWDSEKQSWKNPEELAAMFYYEDSGLYEAYSVSKRVLDLAAFEINDYINDEGNHIPAYTYPPGENYLVSRREYEQIKSKVFEKLTKVADEPFISSGWINVDDVYKWLDSLG